MNIWQTITHRWAKKRAKKELTKALNQALEAKRYYQILPSGHSEWAVQYRTVSHKNPFASWQHFGVFQSQLEAQHAIESNLKMFARGIAENIAEIKRVHSNPPYQYPRDYNHRYLFRSAFNEAMEEQEKNISVRSD